MDLSLVLLHIVCGGLVLGLAGALIIQKPARRLAGPLWSFLLLAMLYIVGDALTQLSEGLERSYFWEELGITLLYTGAIGGAAACWLMPIRFAEVHGCRPVWLSQRSVRVVLSASAAAFVVMVTNPLHGRFITPVVGALNEYPPLWYPLVYFGYAQVAGAVALFAYLVRRGPDRRVRRNAAIMALGPLSLLVSNFFYYELVRTSHGDTSVLGLGLSSLVFLYGSFRSRIFSLLPVGLGLTQQYDPEGLVVASPEGRLLHANPAGLALLGLREVQPGHDVFVRLADRLRESTGQPLDAEALRRRLAGLGGLILRLEDGERSFQAQMTPIPSRSGGTLQLLLRFADVTHMRRVREALEQTIADRTAALRASEARYRTVSHLTSDGAFSIRVQPDGSVEGEWVTQATTELTGLGVADFANQPWREGVHPDDRERVAEALLAPGDAPARVEFRMLRRRSEPLWLALEVGVEERLPDGSLRVVGALRDVDDRRRAEAERRRFERRAQEAQRLESLGALAGGISHDFNNAMAIVLGNADLLRADAGPDTLAVKRLERIRAAARHAADLTDQLLTYAGESEPRIGPLHLGDLLRDMEPLLDVSADGTGQLQVVREQEPLFVNGDATQIRQVVLNLVNNAREAYEGASGLVIVRTGRIVPDAEALAEADASWATADREHAYLDVIDHGSGISDAVRERLFDPFATTKFVGRGLGLSVVLAIVRSHAGAIFVQRRAGHETVFRVLLPATEAPQAAASPAMPTGVPAAGARVLVVDDDEDVLELSEILLGQAGFRVRSAGSGRAALDILLERREAVDVLVLDLAMPDLDGRQVLEALHLERPALPVVLVSGFDRAAVDARLGGIPSAALFLRKPYEPEALVELLHKALAGARGQSSR